VKYLVFIKLDVIVDCCEEDDAQLLLRSLVPNINYLWNPTADDGQHPKPVAWFQKSLDFVLPLLAKPNHHAYLHCAAGVNRGPSTLYAVLIALGIAPFEAEAMIRRARPQVGLAYKDDALAAVRALGYF